MATSTLVDLVEIQILNTGTGTIQLGAAVAAFRGVEALIDGATYSYSIQQGANYETGTGIYTQATGALSRNVLTSSYGGAPIPLAPGAVVAFTALSRDLIAIGAGVPIADAMGTARDIAPSQRAVTAAIAAILSGASAWSLPDEANGDAIPAPGSKLPYLSAGVLKIA